MPRQDLGRFMYAEQVFDTWMIHNKRGGDVLGYIDRYDAWEQYVFTGAETCVFSADCLAEITAFLGRLNKERK